MYFKLTFLGRKKLDFFLQEKQKRIFRINEQPENIFDFYLKQQKQQSRVENIF